MATGLISLNQVFENLEKFHPDDAEFFRDWTEVNTDCTTPLECFASPINVPSNAQLPFLVRMKLWIAFKKACFRDAFGLQISIQV
jgi:hypothetical protein